MVTRVSNADQRSLSIPEQDLTRTVSYVSKMMAAPQLLDKLGAILTKEIATRREREKNEMKVSVSPPILLRKQGR